jgi:hypothetical protein
MKCSKYFGTKWCGFIKSESILAPKGASRFKTQNIRCDTRFIAMTIMPKAATKQELLFYNPTQSERWAC